MLSIERGARYIICVRIFCADWVFVIKGSIEKTCTK